MVFFTYAPALPTWYIKDATSDFVSAASLVNNPACQELLRGTGEVLDGAAWRGRQSSGVPVPEPGRGRGLA